MSPMSAPRKTKQDDAHSESHAHKNASHNHKNENGCGCGVNDCTTESRANKKYHNSDNPNHTKIVIKFNCGFSNNLYIRGEGVQGLSWDKGTLMKCTKEDEWVWETNTPFNKKAQIKVLINDSQYELGENHTIDCGKSFTISPKFF